MKVLLAITALIASGQLLAAAAGIDMTRPLLDEQGKVIKDFSEASKDDPTCKHCAVFTMGIAIQRALDGLYKDEEQLPGDQRWARSVLGARLRSARSIALTAKEVEVIEKVIGKAYTGVVIKQIVPIIDPNKKVPELS